MIKLITIPVMAMFMAVTHGCEGDPPVSSSGIHQVTTSVKAGPNGTTVEQQNIIDRLHMDNLPGSIKHLYIISPYSGQTILYSTVKGKVTSSGKRLTPTTLLGDGHTVNAWQNSSVGYTTEVIQDDGTYGNSTEYIYWWDVQGRYHQHFFTGGQIIHVSDQPIPVKSVIINLEAAQ